MENIDVMKKLVVAVRNNITEGGMGRKEALEKAVAENVKEPNKLQDFLATLRKAMDNITDNGVAATYFDGVLANVKNFCNS